MRARRCELKPRAGRRTVRGARRGAYPKTPRQNTGVTTSVVRMLIYFRYMILTHCVVYKPAVLLIKMNLPDWNKLKRESNMSPDEMRTEMKRKGILPPRTFSERSIIISSTSTTNLWNFMCLRFLVSHIYCTQIKFNVVLLLLLVILKGIKLATCH